MTPFFNVKYLFHCSPQLQLATELPDSLSEVQLASMALY